VTKRAKVKILINYKGLYIFRIYMLLKRELVKSRIVRFSNVRFDKKGLITKPLPEEKDKEETNIQIPVKNKGEATNQDR
jgi:hypothetical protein